MTAIEIIALIVILTAAVKLIVILIKPASWMGVVKRVWKHPVLSAAISLILAAVVLYYLLQELTIVQIFAVMAFVALLSAVSIAAYSEEIMAFGEAILKDRAALKKASLSFVVWIVLIIWALYRLFA